MKYILICLFTISLNAQTTTFRSGQLDANQIQILRENYSWNIENKLIILNFIQPKKNCHYNNYENLNQPSSWWKEFYSKIDTTSAENKFVYSDSIAAKKVIDGKSHFSDPNNFLLNNFFQNMPFCYGVIIINTQGFYKLKGSEYSSSEVSKFLQDLNN